MPCVFALARSWEQTDGRARYNGARGQLMVWAELVSPLQSPSWCSVIGCERDNYDYCCVHVGTRWLFPGSPDGHDDCGLRLHAVPRCRLCEVFLPLTLNVFWKTIWDEEGIVVVRAVPDSELIGTSGVLCLQDLFAQMEQELGEDFSEMCDGVAEEEEAEEGRNWRCSSEHLTDRVAYLQSLGHTKE